MRPFGLDPPGRNRLRPYSEPTVHNLTRWGPDLNLLFGLLALHYGLITQVQLVAAFKAWTLDRARASRSCTSTDTPPSVCAPIQDIACRGLGSLKC